MIKDFGNSYRVTSLLHLPCLICFERALNQKSPLAPVFQRGVLRVSLCERGSCEKIPKSTGRTGGIGKIVGRQPFSDSPKKMKKLCKADELRWFVTLKFSMSASYDFGGTPCPVCELPIFSQLREIERDFVKGILIDFDVALNFFRLNSFSLYFVLAVLGIGNRPLFPRKRDQEFTFI